jgi:pimeloyl-ACP methyl ester carboxylesterase
MAGGARNARRTGPIRRRRALAADGYGPASRSEWLDVDWSEHLRSAVVRDARVNYVEMGDGPPVVFVHGLSGCWQNWLENIPHFARHHRVVAVDLPGFGASQMPREEISMPGYGRFLDAFLGQIGIPRAALVGNSMGGFIAAETAISHPARVERLVLVAAAGGVGPANRSMRAKARAVRLANPAVSPVVARRELLMRRRALRSAMVAGVVRFPDLLHPEIVYEITSGAGKPGFTGALRAVLTYDFRERLPQISCPTLVIWGRNDLIVPVRGAHEYARLIPGAQKVILDHTGHVPMIERPERFNDLVAAFVGDGPAAGGEVPAPGGSETTVLDEAPQIT